MSKQHKTELVKVWNELTRIRNHSLFRNESIACLRPRVQLPVHQNKLERTQ
jgi:hypothetical protein